ncbi:MAG TPA: SRPBCC domain-containing protein [Noviherbaspirillum sp.]
MSNLKRIQFSIDIAAPASTVYALMLAPDTYRDWTAAFAEGAYYEGSWETGQRIRFLAPSGDGMVAEIAENRPDEFVSIRHLGYITKGVDDIDSEASRAWAPAYENYTFTPTSEGTRLVVDQDVTPEFEAYLAEAWPKALQRLKVLCESAKAS